MTDQAQEIERLKAENKRLASSRRQAAELLSQAYDRLDVYDCNWAGLDLLNGWLSENLDAFMRTGAKND